MLSLALVAVFSLALVTGSASAAAPTIASTSVSSVTTKTALLQAEINPEGEATAYSFEYGTADCSSNPCASIPVPNGNVGSGSSAVKVSKEVEGLTPGTTYHFRVVATNASGTSEGPDKTFKTYALPSSGTGCANQEFRIGPAVHLPDCRAYEMVSPADKNGADIVLGASGGQPYSGYMKAAPSGEKIAYSSTGSFAGQPSSYYANHYIATRGPEGWSTKGINLPKSSQSVFPLLSPFLIPPSVQGFSEDLSSVWEVNEGHIPVTGDAIPGFLNMYRLDSLTGAVEAITINQPTKYYDEENFAAEGLSLGLEFRGGSADGKISAYNATAALTPQAGTNVQQQAYVFSEGEVRLASILPNGTPVNLGATIGVSNGNTLEEPSFGFLDTVARAVSDDGSRVFWTAGTSPGPGDLYVRENPTQPQSALDGGGECTEPAKACTIPVSAGGDPARFWTASPDGSEVLFSTGSGLGSTGLYEFDVESETTTQVAAQTLGVLGAADDLSYVYFVSELALDAGAVAGERNLYLHHAGTDTFIGALSELDVVPWSNFSTNVVSPKPGNHASRVTPDGRHLAFTSDRSLTGYDNTDAVSGKPDREVFLFDADSGELTCASCNPSGARPVGQPFFRPYSETENPEFGSGYAWQAAWVPSWERELQASRVISEDGSRLFFESIDSLVPRDTNGVVDVYQWEDQGSGSCDQAGGCVSLISTGESSTKSDFIDASADGKDVFIRTAASLVSQDLGSVDLYNARAGGGYPVPVSPPECLGDACQAVPQPPLDPTPASASFHGAGNPTPAKPRRGCRARSRQGKQAGRAAKRSKAAKSCKRHKRGAKR